MQANKMEKSLQTSEKELNAFSSPEELATYALTTLQDSDMETVRTSLTVLYELQGAAETLEDMQGELPTEITQTCLMLRKKMAKLVQAKSLFSQ